MTRPDEVRAAVRRAGELYADFLAGLDRRRVAPGTAPETLDELLGNSLGERGIGMAAALERFAGQVLPHSMTTPHPLYLGLVNSSPLPMAPVADLLVSMLDNNSGSEHQSPAITACEREVVRAFGSALGLEGRRGMVLPGGSYANLQGLLLARARAFPEWRRRGPAAAPARPLVYTSAARHFSVERAVQVAGIGEEQVVAVPAVGRGAIDTGGLAERVSRDRAGGAAPFAVVATVGTTGTGAVDDVAAVAAVCEAHGLWLHVDACYGGAAALVPELRPLCRGWERADSVAVDPHKWFFQPITAGLLLTRHPDVEEACFGVDASYIPGRADDAFRHGIPTSRRGTALTVWLTLLAHGWEEIRAAVARNVAWTRRLEERLRAEGFHVLPGGGLSIACARWEPEGMDPDATDRLQERIAARVVADGTAWFSTTRWQDRTWLRFNLVNVHTREEHLDRLVAALCAARPA